MLFMKYIFKAFVVLIACFCLQKDASAQKVYEPASPANWSQPYPAFRIVGNLYYVGTQDLACYLVTTPKGHILINTGLADSEKTISDAVTNLGFNLSDIKILLTTQAHYDHVGAMAALKKKSGARFWVNAKDAPVAADGGSSDYALGTGQPSFEPIKADRLLKDGDSIILDNTVIVLLHHPGHTKGSSSYLLEVRDAQKSYRVLIANMPSIVTSQRFRDIKAYPEIECDYAYTLEAMKKISFDLWLSSHAAQFNMHRKRSPGDPYQPESFAGRIDYEEELDRLAALFEEKRKQ